MRIGELSRRSGLAPSRIRFYESIGLLTVVERRANGYRDYPPEALKILDIIDFAQKAGFALDEIRPLLPETNTATWRRDELLASLERKVEDVERLQRRLAETKRQLLSVIASVRDKPEDLDCMDNVAPTLARAR